MSHPASFFRSDPRAPMRHARSRRRQLRRWHRAWCKAGCPGYWEDWLYRREGGRFIERHRIRTSPEDMARLARRALDAR